MATNAQFLSTTDFHRRRVEIVKFFLALSFALALAGAIVSATINSMAGELPLFIAVILIVFAHVLNIILSIMGGVIHGLRLNFLEWYHYSFEGGGRKFTPLELHIFD